MPVLCPRLLCLAALGLIAAPADAAEEDSNIWLAQFATINASEKVFVRLEARERFTDDAGRLGRLLARSLVGYRIDKRTSIGVGYAYVFSDPVGPLRRNEHRFYQEFNHRLIETEGGVTVDARTRLEQRTFEESDGTAWRLRQFVQVRVPLSQDNKLVAFAEPFIDLNQTAVQRGGVSLWRNFVGVSVPLTKNAERVPGYLNQYVVRGGADRIDHTANIGLFMTF